jgi:protein-tyrosine phosphatase
MTNWINRQFGTWRGLVRALLANAELATGRLRPFMLHHPEQVRRVVPVCLGNICRSAYAHHIAVECGLPVASFGLSTHTGGSSPKAAVAAARRRGVDMTAHRATDWNDFKVQPGDLMLVMEVRQAHELRKRLGPRDDVQVCLLGLWCKPPMPHLHDPYTLSDAYFDTSFRRVDQAMRQLSVDLRHLRQVQHGQPHLQPEPQRAL